ncbi:SusC/RagA family TonB-linked outer membrane protein [Prolixibacter bellariivorans]|uniref:SusC/RagA family TonB-linked outer membrane protein n=2 Tax=Prolixibacter bellariivorans TaxID=314319 RepID=UPI000470D03E|nr:SusC/RagA family TonB-linked outer membrane protein [Prolixibacter bellariivorans]
MNQLISKIAQKWVLVFMLLGIWSTQVFAQGVTVHGTVKTNANEPITGVNVVIKGTTQGTITDLDGKYSIHVNSPDDILVFSFIGYVPQEKKVANNSVIDVILQEDVKGLEEVVVMGYSDKKRNEITSAVTTVSADKLKDVTSNNIGTMLQGKVAGIQVFNGSGQPGAMPDVRIRGISSMSAPQGPLYVVDGIIGGTFDPNDVESITVLKDAGATGMYGSQANGGVIVVTTKKASGGSPSVNIKAVTGIRMADHGNVHMMDSRTLYNYQRELYRDPKLFVIDDSKFLQARPKSILDVNTNWLKETFKPALVQNYYVSSTGKTKKLSFYLGGSYYDEGGTFINTSFKRINLRANTTYRLSDRISIVNNINLSGSKTRSADYMNIYYSYVNMPWDNPYDENGNPRSFKEADGIWSKDKINPIQAADNSNLTNLALNVDYDFDLNIKLLDWLTFSSTNRLSVDNGMDKQFYAKNADNLSYYGTGYVSSTSNISYGGITTNLFKFRFDKNDNSLNGLVGAEAQRTNNDYITGSGQGMPEGLSAPSVASSNFAISGAPGHTVMQSFISQLNYNYKGKYFFTGSYRIDQSSAFSPENRTAYFPSLSGAWLLSQENFMKTTKAIDNLKLKASWGKTGMKDIGASKYLGQFAYTTQIDGQVAAVPFQLANPNLTWEQTTQVNVGLEVGLFNRVNLNVNAYNNLTNNLLVYRNLPPSGGFSKQWQNTGSVTNKGIELSMSSTNINTRKVTWTTDFSISFNKNSLTDFGNDTIINANTYGITQIYRDGGSLYTWYAKEYYGVDPQDGSMLWVGEDGNPTHEYQAARKVEYGSPIPKIEGGFSTSFRYADLTLSANCSFVTGNKIYNYFRRYVDNDLQDPQFNTMMPRDDWKLWQQPGDIANHPLPQNARNSFDPSTRYIEDGSYLKIRNISLTYKLHGGIIERLKMKSVNVSLSADNVYTFTRFWGQDPEVSINPLNGLPGYAEFKYPNSKQYVLGVNINF